MLNESIQVEHSKRHIENAAHRLSRLASLLIILAQFFICKYSTALSDIAAPDILVMATCIDVMAYLGLVNLIFPLVQAQAKSDEEALDMFFEEANAMQCIDLQRCEVASDKCCS